MKHKKNFKRRSRGSQKQANKRQKYTSDETNLHTKAIKNTKKADTKTLTRNSWLKSIKIDFKIILKGKIEKIIWLIIFIGFLLWISFTRGCDETTLQKLCPYPSKLNSVLYNYTLSQNLIQIKEPFTSIFGEDKSKSSIEGYYPSYYKCLFPFKCDKKR